MAIRNIYNLKYNDRTLHDFTKAEILRLPELCYVKAGIVGPFHVQKLWTRLASTRGTGRYSDRLLYHEATSKQWLHNLAPIAQVKLWNQEINRGLQTVMSDLASKQKIKLKYLFRY